MSTRSTISLPGKPKVQPASAIRLRLDAPERTVDLAALADLWHDCEITWTIADLGKAVSDPGLPGRMRGAFGDELLARASPEAARGDPCPWDPPSAFEVLFRKQGHIEPGLFFPSPWVLELDSINGDLQVTVRIFGFAADYSASVAEVLTSALRNTVDYGGRTGHFFPKAVITHRTVKAGTKVSVGPTPNGIILDFLTPVTLTGNPVRQNPRGLITTATARLAGLARWHDMELETDRDALIVSSRLLEFEWVEAAAVRWQRGSSRQKKSFSMEGLVGRLVIAGEADDLLLATNILTLGERTHIGADIAFGCGRYTLTIF